MRRVGLIALLGLFGCETGGLPPGWMETPAGSGPAVVWDIAADPLPEVPLPNDVATWPDPASPTGRRINASMVAPTQLEQITRGYFDELDGWGTYAPITVRFQAPIDVDDVLARQGENRFGGDDWPRHAVYLVNLETGIPVPLDLNGGNNQYALQGTDRYWDNDYHRTESNVMFETLEEDDNGNGVLDPGEDIDFDDVLDHPNTIDGTNDDPLDAYDGLLTFYERETDTMLVRPMVPLREQTRYAVVLTDRLRGMDGQPVRSPFQHVHHVSQMEALEDLPARMADHPEIYGDLATRGWSGVAFAWTFTTQSVTGDLFALREGLYGRGAFAHLAQEFPPHLTLTPIHGQSPLPAHRFFECGEIPRNELFTISYADLRDVLDRLGMEAFELGAEDLLDLLNTYENSVSHFALGFFETPYLLGEPDEDNVYERWQIDRERGEARIDRDLVPMMITIPNADQDGDGVDEYRQPFPVAFYGHGYTSMKVESLGFAGMMASHGVATVGIDAQAHGLGLEDLIIMAVENIFARECLWGMAQGLLQDRAFDHNGDGMKDSAGIYWTSYVFHTRDVVRQSVLDHMQAIRVLRHFGLRPGISTPDMWTPGSVQPEDPEQDRLVFDDETPEDGVVDIDGDGSPDIAGDLDGNGVPDLGGWDNDYYAWGQSLGGILSGLLVGAEPAVTAAAPTAGAGGLIDVGVRSVQGGVREAVILRTIGPLVVGWASPGDTDRIRTSCATGERSLRFVVPDVNSDVSIEFACVPMSDLEDGDVVIVRNITAGETRCAAWRESSGGFRIGLPSDTRDIVQIEIYDGGSDQIRYGDRCEWLGEPPAIARQINTWEVNHGTGGLAGTCRECATYQGHEWVAGETLVTPTEGFGLGRQTPDLRRFMGLAQIALEPGDPGNYARHIFIEPIGVEDVAGGVARPRNVLVVNTVGDQNVPLNGGNAYARAAGVLPFMPPSAPDAFAEYRAPPEFEATYGATSPNQWLIDHYVYEGVARLGRWPIEGGPSHFLFDPDDLSEGQQWFNMQGSGQLAPGGEEPAFRPARADPPLRWVRASRAMAPWGEYGVFSPAGVVPDGISGVLNAMIIPEGQHGFDAPNTRKVWDESMYLANLLGWYFASGGTDLLYHSDPDGHHCLETMTCRFGVDPE